MEATRRDRGWMVASLLAIAACSSSAGDGANGQEAEDDGGSVSGSGAADAGAAGGAGGGAGSGQSGEDGGSGTGDEECPDGITCKVDYPCYLDQGNYYPHCDGDVRMTPREVSCEQSCGTPCCSGGSCYYESEPCETGMTCVMSDQGPTCAPGCGGPETFADTATYLNTVWVSVSRGHDISADGSYGMPFWTIEAALRVALPGDQVFIEHGTYDGDIWFEGLQGTEDNPIYVGGVPDSTREVVIDGGGEGLHLVNPRYVVLENFRVSNAASNGINIDDGGDYATPAEHVVIRNVTIGYIGSGGNNDCLKLSGLDHFFVLDGIFANCGSAGTQGSGIDMVGCHDGQIVGNSFNTMGANAVQAKGGSERIVIARNHVVDGGARAFNLGGSTDPQYFRPPEADYEARDLWAFSNIIDGAEASIAFVGCDDCLAANNTIVDPGRWVVRILQESVAGFVPCRNGRFINNIAVYTGELISTEVNVGPDTEPDTFTFSHNLWYDRSAPGSEPDLPVSEEGQVLFAPLLGDPANGDYSLGSSSPARGAGTALNEVTATFEGACPADPPNIGAL